MQCRWLVTCFWSVTGYQGNSLWQNRGTWEKADDTTLESLQSHPSKFWSCLMLQILLSIRRGLTFVRSKMHFSFSRNAVVNQSLKTEIRAASQDDAVDRQITSKLWLSLNPIHGQTSHQTCHEHFLVLRTHLLLKL